MPDKIMSDLDFDQLVADYRREMTAELRRGRAIGVVAGTCRVVVALEAPYGSHAYLTRMLAISVAARQVVDDTSRLTTRPDQSSTDVRR